VTFLSLEAYRTAEMLERTLGDPLDGQNLFSFQRQIELDEQEAFPAEICAFLYRWGLFDYFIPAQVGGKLASFEEALALLRVLARRDLTVAIALGQTYLGAIHVWLAGSDEQKHRVAHLIRQYQLLAFALTERAHGGDILANDVHAMTSAAGYHLTGEKWLINNGTRARALTVFARTDPKGGARGFSLFLVDKECLDSSSYVHCPKVKTHGIRGADISGIRFHESLIPLDARIGQTGAGLEISLHGLMVTRTLCAGFSLGAADSALRTVLAFAQERRIYGDTVFAIPHAQTTLAYAFSDLLIADCVGLAAARGLHVVPEQFSVWSAIVKYFVPTTVESLIRDLAVVLGARYYLREEHNSGIFQKLLRDNAVVSLFDGSTVVNLSALCVQLASLLGYRRKPAAGGDEQLRTRLAAIFCLARPLPEFAGSRLTLFNRGQDDVLQGLPIAVEQLGGLNATVGLDPGVLQRIVTLANDLVEQLQVEDQSVQEVTSSGDRTVYRSPAMFELAKRYCTLHAAAACLQLWLYNRATLGDFFASGEWLVLALDRLLAVLRPRRDPLPPSFVTAVAGEAVRLFEHDKAFSIVPFQLNGTNSTVNSTTTFDSHERVEPNSAPKGHA
jgi:alkylation response protein AidB-like acyl-CoA dehydrogenase